MDNNFDRRFKSMVDNEPILIPTGYHDMVEKTLSNLDRSKSKSNYKNVIFRFGKIAAIFVICTVLVLPNISYDISLAMEEFPFIGKFIHAITLRNYEVDDEYHQLKARIPMVSVDENNISQEVADTINKKILEDTRPLIDEFYRDMELIKDEGHTGLYIDYEEITNNEQWYTLKLILGRTSASGNVEYRFYNVDKNTGQIVYLKDLFKSDTYKVRIYNELKKQMTDINKKSEYPIYWVKDFEISKNMNFYLDKDGELHIVFNEYEVAPGAYGCPEFKVSREVYKDLLK